MNKELRKCLLGLKELIEADNKNHLDPKGESYLISLTTLGIDGPYRGMYPNARALLKTTTVLNTINTALTQIDMLDLLEGTDE